MEEARSSSCLYVLGDLFEFWLGDDVGLRNHETFIKTLKVLTDSGCTLTVMHGNRDFLLGEEFARATGANLVTADELTISLAGEPALLMHGDTLCTDDTDYQAFRSSVRDPGWQSRFLDQSIAEREKQARHLRVSSQQASQHKSATIMDVNAKQVQRRLAENDCRVMIHGHTHRPAVHQPAVPGSSTSPDSVESENLRTTRRYVVGDWHPDHAQYVRFDGSKLELCVYR